MCSLKLCTHTRTHQSKEERRKKMKIKIHLKLIQFKFKFQLKLSARARMFQIQIKHHGTMLIYAPFSKLSICSFVNDVRFRCNFRLRRKRNWLSSSPDEFPPLSELPSDVLSCELASDGVWFKPSTENRSENWIEVENERIKRDLKGKSKYHQTNGFKVKRNSSITSDTHDSHSSSLKWYVFHAYIARLTELDRDYHLNITHTRTHPPITLAFSP